MVRDRYGAIGRMRERGLSWSEISETLATEGATTRDGAPYPAVTLRSAFFLVTNEERAARPRAPEIAGPSLLEPAPPRVVELVETIAPPAPIAAEPREPEPVIEPPPAIEPVPEPGGAIPNPPPPGVAQADLFESPPERAESASFIRPAVVEETPPSVPATVDPPIESVPEATPAISIPEAAPVAAKEAAGDKLRLDRPERNADNAAASEPPTAPEPPSEPLRGHHMLGTIFVLNDRGGVGKTLLSHHLMATAMLEGLQLRVVEYEVNERLARLYGAELVEHRRITQDFMNLMGSGDGFFEYWDQIGPELQRGGRLFDFGGNISQWFFNWAEVSGFDYYVGEGERLTFMVPVTVDLASLQTGMATLDRIAVIAPKAKRVLVENGISGPFSQLEESQYGRRKAELVEREGVEVISMPSCTAPAWARLTGHRLDQVAKMTREDLVKLGMTPPVASRSLIIIHEWLRNMRAALSPFVHGALTGA